MPININGPMTITLEVPCCNNDKLTLEYKTTDNTVLAEQFKVIMAHIGIKATLTDLEAKKGGG